MIRTDVSAGLFAIVAATLLGCTLAGGQPDGAGQTAHSDAYARGKANLAAGRLGLAVNDLQEALEQEGPSVERLNALAAAYDRLGRFDLADRYYREALAINPAAPLTMNNIGYSYFLRGRADLAAAFLARAKAVASDDPVIAGNLALVTAAVERKPATPQAAEPVLASVRPVTPASKPKPAVYIEQTAKGVYNLVTAASEQAKFVDEPSASGDLALATIPPVIEPMPAVAAAPVAAVVREALPEPTPALDRTQAGDRTDLKPALIEVSNGSGIEGSAARVRAFLRDYGVLIQRLTNDARFGHPRTVLFYRDGFRDAALAVASMLPTAISLERNDAQYPDLRLRLGLDSQSFDTVLASKLPSATAAERAALSLGEPAAAGTFGLSVAEPMLTMVAMPAIRTRLETAIVEVSNGSGIDRSAERVGAYLREHGIPVQRLTNDAQFDHPRSVLFYRDGFRDAAAAMATELPTALSIERDDTQDSDLRLRLGRDSEHFIKSLIFRIQTARL